LGCGLGTTAKYLRNAAGIDLVTTIKYLRRSRSSAAGNGVGTTIKCLRGAACIGLGTTVKYLRRTTSTAAGNGLGTAIKYLVNQNAGAGLNFGKAHYTKAGTTQQVPATERFFGLAVEISLGHGAGFYLIAHLLGC
jgi:hypothetical protein